MKEATLRIARSVAAAVLLASILGLAPESRGETQAPPAEPAQPAPEKLSEQDFAKPMGSPDPFNRGTPRGAAWGFAIASRKGDYERAAKYLDLRWLPPEERERAPEIARQLRAALGRALMPDFASFSDRAEGFADDGLPTWQDQLGAIETGEGLVTILLQRVPREGDGVRIWKISSETVARTDELYEEFGPTWLETWLPPFFFETRFLRIEISDWVEMLALAIGGWLVSVVLAGIAIRVLARIWTAREHPLDERVVRIFAGQCAWP